MKKLIIAAITTLTLAAINVSPVLAWHPKAEIIKKVQNQTTNSQLVDANDVANAVATKPGDIIRYVIEVTNIAQPASNNYNDLAFTVVTDDLPAGVELVTNPGQHKITENLGTLKPGQKVVKEYQLKVTSNTDGAVITNEACVNGDSEVKDNPQHDCNKAIIKVSVPKQDEPKKEEPKKEILPAQLPQTGPESAVAGAFGLGAFGYGLNAYLRSRRSAKPRA